MSDLRRVSPRLAELPLQYKVWVAVLYWVGTFLMGCMVGSIVGGIIVVFTNLFSFQFWTYAVWNGLRKSEDMGVDPPL